MALQYFAMIDGQRTGPLTLEQLGEAGVRPDTYVWRKGLPDWIQAADDADICRYWRQRIFNAMHPSAPPAVHETETQAAETPEDPYAQVPLAFRRMAERHGIPPGPVPEPDDEEILNGNLGTSSLLLLSVMMTLLCFPLTGFVAIYMSVLARRTWEDANRSASRGSSKLYTDEERKTLRRLAFDYARQARMWIGITFFMGVIFYAFLFGHVI